MARKIRNMPCARREYAFVVMRAFPVAAGTFDDCMRRDGDMVAAARRGRAPRAALGMAVCGAAMWMLIGAFMKPYARTAAEIVARAEYRGPSGRGDTALIRAWMVNCYITTCIPAFFLLFALLWLILGAACLGGGRISAGFGDRVSVAPTYRHW